jgi:hypothetical protein
MINIFIDKVKLMRVAHDSDGGQMFGFLGCLIIFMAAFGGCK